MKNFHVVNFIIDLRCVIFTYVSTDMLCLTSYLALRCLFQDKLSMFIPNQPISRSVWLLSAMILSWDIPTLYLQG